jgi:peptidyl-prolyl cis-trans isomerase B (cyclophilin B)
MTKNNRWKRLILLTALLPAAFACTMAISGCSAKNDDSSGDANDAKVQEETDFPKVEITMEDGGKILLELDDVTAPKTVANFLKLVNEKFYDGLTFHRIIPGFVIQGGDPLGTGMGGSEELIEGEFASNGVKNSISHKRGTISMARSRDYNSASSQFFITNADAFSLDGDYAAFGWVTDGMDVVDRISAVETTGGQDGRPVEPVVIKSIRVVE